MITLKGKVALITGASSGIGRATAILFSKLGSSLILNGRNEEKLDDTIVECEKSGNCEVNIFNIDFVYRISIAFYSRF